MTNPVCEVWLQNAATSRIWYDDKLREAVKFMQLDARNVFVGVRRLQVRKRPSAW